MDDLESQNIYSLIDQARFCLLHNSHLGSLFRNFPCHSLPFLFSTRFTWDYSKFVWFQLLHTLTLTSVKSFMLLCLSQSDKLLGIYWVNRKVLCFSFQMAELPLRRGCPRGAWALRFLKPGWMWGSCHLRVVGSFLPIIRDFFLHLWRRLFLCSWENY